MKVISNVALLVAALTAPLIAGATKLQTHLRVADNVLNKSSSDPDLPWDSGAEAGQAARDAGQRTVELMFGDRVYHPTKVQLAAMNVLAYNKECDEDPETMGQMKDDYAMWYWKYEGSMTHAAARAAAPVVKNLLKVDHSCLLQYATAQEYTCEATWHQTSSSRKDWDTGASGGDWGSAGHLYKSGEASKNPYPRRKFAPTPTGYTMQTENSYYEVFPTTGLANMNSGFSQWSSICVIVIRGSDDLRNGKAVSKLKAGDHWLFGGPDGIADTDDRITRTENPFSFPANINGYRATGCRGADIGSPVNSTMHYGLMKYYEDRVQSYIRGWRRNETDCGLWMYSGHSLGGAMASIAAISFDPLGCPGNMGVGKCGDTLRQQQGQAYTFGALPVFYTGSTLARGDVNNWNGGFRLFHNEDPAAQLAANPGEGSVDTKKHKGMQHRGGVPGATEIRQNTANAKPVAFLAPTGGACPDVITAAYRDTKGCWWKTHRMWGGAYMHAVMRDEQFWSPGSRTDWLVGGSDQAGWTCDPMSIGQWDPTDGHGADVVEFLRDQTGQIGPNP